MRKIQFTTNHRARALSGWQKQTFENFETLMGGSWFGQHHDYKEKDGSAFVPGRMLGKGQRNNKSVEAIEALVYDLDGQMTWDEADELLANANVEAFLYTTYSHRTQKTLVETDKYVKWAEMTRVSRTPTQETMEAYLKSIGKEYLRTIRFDPEAYERVADVGNCYIVHHDPLDKMRIIFPLTKPIVLSELHQLNGEAGEIYKQIYVGVANAFKLPYDIKCADPAHCFYYPAYPAGADIGIHRRQCFGGDWLDWKAYPRASLPRGTHRRDVTGAMVRRSPTDFIVFDKNNKRIDLRTWNREHGMLFDMSGLLERSLPEDMLGPPRAGKEGRHITCPFEQGHSSTGGTGTFVAPGDGDQGWNIHCTHNSCAQRDRMDHLKQIIQDGHVTREDLGLGEEVTDEQRLKAAEAMGLDADTAKFIMDRDIIADDDGSALKPTVDVGADTVAIEGACYDQVKNATELRHVRGAVASLKDAGVEIKAENFIECFAHDTCQISGAGIKKLARDLLPHFEIDPEDMVRMTMDARLEAIHPEKRYEDLLNHGYGGFELDRELNKWADWYSVARSTFRRSFNGYRKVLDKEETDERLAKRALEFDEQYALLKLGTRVVFMDMPQSLKTQELFAFDKDSLVSTYESQSVKIMVKDKNGDLKPRKECVVKHWFKEGNPQRYNGITFDPSKNPKRTDDNRFNLWTGNFAVRPMEGDPTPANRHVREVWCAGDEHLYWWTMTWLADIFQNPGVKHNTAILLRGPPGTGKSVLCDVGLQHMLGNMYAKSAEGSALTGKFNSFSGGKLFFLAEEVLFAGDARAINTLKDRISSDTIDIEPKGKERYTIPNFTRYMFTSNKTHPIALESDDRRFVVLYSDPKYKQDIPYHENLVNWFKNENGCSIWLHYLLHFKPENHGMNWLDLRTPPMTEAKADQIQMSRSPGEDFFHDLLVHGRITSMPSGASVPGKVSWELDSQLAVSPERFRNIFNAYLAARMGTSARFDQKEFTTLFVNWFSKKPSKFGSNERSDRHGAKGHAYIWRFPKRREVLMWAAANNLVSKEDMALALANTFSHIDPVGD